MITMKMMVAEVLRNFSVHTDVAQSDIRVKMTDAFTRNAGGYPIAVRTRDRRPSYARNGRKPTAADRSPSD